MAQHCRLAHSGCVPVGESRESCESSACCGGLGAARTIAHLLATKREESAALVRFGVGGATASASADRIPVTAINCLLLLSPAIPDPHLLEEPCVT